MGIGTEFKNENLCLSVLKKIARLYRDAYTGFPKQAWILFSMQLVNASGFMVIFFLSLYLTNKLDFTLAQAGRTISIFGVGSLLGAWFGGWLSDNIGSTNVQKLSLPLLGAFLAQRAGTGSQVKYMGLFSLAFSVSLILGPAVGSYIYAAFGPNVLWSGCGILGFVLFILFRTLSPFLQKMPAPNFQL